MKVICDRGALVEALNIVGQAVVGRTPKPVLTCVRVTATEDAMALAATDMETAVSLSTAQVEVSEPGQALIPADKLSQIVRESADATLTIETEGETAHVRGQDSHFKVYGYPVGDFPEVPSLEQDHTFEIGAGELSQMIHQTTFATARENSRYAINGVLIERDGTTLHIVATDGHRLALTKGQCKLADGSSDDDQPQSAIVPTKALQMLERLLDDPEMNVRVKLAANQIIFLTDDAVLSSNLVEGNFPPFRDVIPRDGDKKATLNTDVMTHAVRRAALLTNEESKGVRMAFSPDGLELTSRAPEMGEAEIHVDCPSYSGDPIEIGFNPHYVLDALKVVQADEVTFEFKAGNKPGVMRTGGGFLYVVMPVNLQ